MFEDSVSTLPSIWASMNSWFTPTVLFVFLNLMIGTIFFTSSLANQTQKQQQTTQQDDQHQPQTLPRSPSVLQRLRSINLYSYRSPEPIPSQPSISTTTTTTTTTQFKQIPDLGLTHQQLNPETQTQFVFQQIGEPKTPEMENRFVSELTHEREDEGEEDEEDWEEEEEEQQSMDEIYSQLNDHNHNHVSRTKSDTKPTAGEIPAKLPAKMRKSASSKSAFGHFKEADIVEVRRPATVRERRAKAAEGDDEVDAKADDFINKFKQQLKLQRLDSIIRYKEMIGRGSGK